MSTVEFPGLWGLKVPIEPVALSIGNINIFWYGIIIAIAFTSAVLLAMRDSKNYGIDQESIIDLVLFTAPIAIICARIYYVIFKWEDYKVDLSETYKIWHGGLAIYGGIIGGLLTAYFFARYKKIPVLRLFDLGVPYLVLAQAIGRWGNFVNQEAYGANTTLPWGMTSKSIQQTLEYLRGQGVNVDPAMPVHPTFLYESLWNLGTFALLMWYRKRKKFEGELFYLYMVIYGLGRACIEGLRLDSLMVGNLRISQLLALVFAAVFGVLLVVKLKKAGNSAGEAVPVGASEYGSILEYVKEMKASEDNTDTPEHKKIPVEDTAAQEQPDAAGNENNDRGTEDGK